MRYMILSVFLMLLNSCSDESPSLNQLPIPQVSVQTSVDPKSLPIQVQMPEPAPPSAVMVQFIGVTTEDAGITNSNMEKNDLCYSSFIGEGISSRMCTDAEIVNTFAWPKHLDLNGRAQIRSTFATSWSTNNSKSVMLAGQAGNVVELTQENFEAWKSREGMAIVGLLYWSEGGNKNFEYIPHKLYLGQRYPVACCALVNVVAH